MLYEFVGINSGPRYTVGPPDGRHNGGCVDIIRTYNPNKSAIPDISTPTRPTMPRRKIVVATYNYRARQHDDVSFRKGDRMEVIDDSENDWWKVVHLETREEGLIPGNFVAEEKSIASEEYVY